MKIYLFLILFTIQFCITSAYSNEMVKKPNRAIWIWEDASYAMVENQDIAKDAIHFMKKNNINTLYLYADSFKNRNLLVEKPETYRKFIKYAHDQNMYVYALLGSAYLNTETYILPERRIDALSMFHRILMFNKTEPEDSRFDGINLDIEPHILDEWNEGTKHRLLENFLDMSEDFMKLKNIHNVQISVGPAIPFWLDGIELLWKNKKKPVSEHVIDLYDYVALMDYRDKAEGRDSILSHAENEINYANKINKKVVIGLETTKNEINKVSFYEEGHIYMEKEIEKVTKALNDEPSFDGYAIHHYKKWRQWIESSKSK